MKIYTVTEVAAELLPGISSKEAGRTLRRWLRDHSGFEAPGSGSKWVITTSMMPKIRSEFPKFINRPSKSAHKTNTNGESMIPDHPGLTARQAKDPAAVRKITKERVDRLEAALKARGLHISQMRDRDTFRAVNV